MKTWRKEFQIIERSENDSKKYKWFTGPEIGQDNSSPEMIT